jgi:small nuclear ribonucleoprotein (snRNP)-like protein
MRPLDLLNLNLNRAVTIQIKKNQRYIGVLAGFDEHLNMYLENVKNEYLEIPEEEVEPIDDEDDVATKGQTPADKIDAIPVAIVPIKHEEPIGNMVLRGDNIIFLRIDKPVFAPRLPQKPGYGRPRYDEGGPRREYPRPYPPRRDGPAGQGGQGGQGGGRRDYPPRRDGPGGQGGQGGGRRDYPPRRDGPGAPRGGGSGGSGGGGGRRDYPPRRDDRPPQPKPQGKPIGRPQRREDE